MIYIRKYEVLSGNMRGWDELLELFDMRSKGIFECVGNFIPCEGNASTYAISGDTLCNG